MTKFTDNELDEIYEFHNQFGPRGAFRFYKGLKSNVEILTSEVEEFIVSFYTEFNARRFPAF